jgi:VCBS repeat-containing protein
VAAEAGRSAAAAFNGSGLTLDPVSGKLIHGSDESGGPVAWSIPQETGGFLIDLGAAYTVDVLQIWNMNLAGLESYGTSTFDLWVGDNPTTLTRVLNDEPLARALAGDVNYLGQAFRFSGATAPVIPAELGDESGGVTDLSGIVIEGRYLFLGDLRGTAGGGHVGLSEVRLYGRDAAAEDLVFVTGDGKDDATVTFRGTMAALNAALDGVVYTPNVNYNSGNPNAVPPNVVPDQLVITVNDLGNTDVLTPPGNTNPAIGTALTGTGTVSITVRPIQDAPTLDVSQASGAVAEEDAATTLGPIVIDDVDYADGGIVYDPDWRAQVTLTARHGVLTLPPGTPTPLVFTAGDGAADQTMTFQGTLADLTAALAAVQYRGDLDYNSGNPNATVSNVVPDEILVTLNDLGNTDVTTPPGNTDPNHVNALIQTDTILIRVNPKNDAPEIPTVPGPVSGFEDTVIPIPQIVVADRDQPDDPDWIGQVTLSAGQGTLSLTNPFFGGITFVTGDGVDDPVIAIRGTLPQLNAALDGTRLTYLGNLDYNSGNPNATVPNVVPDVLTVEINDLGHTDVTTPPGNTDPLHVNALTATEVIAIVVGPKNDAPTIDTSAVVTLTVEEDVSVLLEPIVINDVDAANDPDWRGRVTLTAANGLLTLPKDVRSAPLVENIGLPTQSSAHVVYVIDTSFSTIAAQFGGSPVGDLDGNGTPDQILDAEIAGFRALNDQLISQFGSAATVSIVDFSSAVLTKANDMDPAAAGVQFLTNADADKDNNGRRDVEEVLGGFTTGFGTDYREALRETVNVLQTLGKDPAATNVIFISDGQPVPNFDFTAELAALQTLAGNIRAFGAGSGADLTYLQVIDPNAQIFTTTDELLAVFSGSGVVVGTGGLTIDGRTGGDGSITINPENGEGGTRDEDYVINRAGLVSVLVDDDSDPLTPEVNKLVHTRGLDDDTKWSIQVQNGGLMIDFGKTYTLDVLQLWNFNVPGLEDYGASSFDLWVSINGTDLPADTSTMTQLLDDVPLNRAGVASNPNRYFGETVLLGAATNVIPDELHDEDGATILTTDMNGMPLEVTGRYLYIGDLKGTASAGGNVGLSEIQFYARQFGNPKLTYIEGNGFQDMTVTIEGTLDELNQALAAVQYLSKPNYNSGSPDPGNVIPDVVRIDVSDLGNTDSPSDPANSLTATADLAMTVAPAQDTPLIVPSTLSVPNAVEDVELALPPMTFLDADERGPVSTLGPSPGNAVATIDRNLDTNWLGEITLSVSNGTLRFTDDMITEPLPRVADGVAISAAGRNANATVSPLFGAAPQVIDGTGLSVDALGRLIHSTVAADAWALPQESGGLMIDLGAEYNIDVMQVWNYNANGLEASGPQFFDLFVAPDGPAPTHTGQMTRVVDDEPLNRALQFDTAYLGETYLFSAAAASYIPPQLGDEFGGPTDLSSIDVRGRYVFIGGLQGEPGLGSVGLSEVQLFGRPAAAPNVTLVSGDLKGGQRTMQLRGSMADLNNLLDGLDGSIRYVPDPDYNSGNPNAAVPNLVQDRLIVVLDDLGNTDADGTFTAATTTQVVVDIFVNPAQDTPLVDLSRIGTVTVDGAGKPSVSVSALEDAPLVLGPIVAFDVDAQPTYNPAGPLSQYDPTVPGWNGYDPDWRGRVTLSAVHGTLSLDTSLVPQDLTGLWSVLDDSAVNGTQFDDPTIALAPVGGEGGSRDEAGLMGVIDPVTGTSSSGLFTTAARQGAHSQGVSDFTKWLVQDAAGQAGLLISLPGEFTIDVLQLWNFNASGLESYGIDQFELYTAPAGVMPASLADWTRVLQDNPDTAGTDESVLQVGSASGIEYLGETFVFGGADPAKVVPPELGDANGLTARSEAVTGQYVFLKLKNDQTYVGLSELKLYGRPTGAADVTIITGDGVADKQVTLEGSLLALNTALSTLTYQGDPDYNSGTPVPVADQVTVTIEDHWAGKAQPSTGTGPAPNSFEAAIVVVVEPTQDDPAVVIAAGQDQVSLDEDTSLTLSGLSIADIDAQYDADWIGQLDLSVQHGTLSLPPAFTTRELFETQRLTFRATDVQGTAADGTVPADPETNGALELRDVAHLLDDSGLSLSASGKLVHAETEATGANSWSISARTGGVLIDFGDIYTIEAMQLWNLNVAGELLHGADQLDIYAWDRLPDGALDDAGHQVNAGSLALAQATGAADYEGQTFRFGGFVNQPSELGGSVTDVPQTLSGRYVFLKLADDDTTAGDYHLGLSELKFYGGPSVNTGRINQVTGTDGAGGTMLTPDTGSAGDPRGVSHLFDGSGLSLNGVGQLIHGSDESLGSVGWSVPQDDGGVLIDLGAVYTLDVMQIWNFNSTNAAGADLTGYGATSFDLWTGDSLVSMTQVLANVPLPLATFNDTDYQGETYLFSGRLPTSIPKELGDENGAIEDLSATQLTGRYLFIGGLQTNVAGTDPQPGHLGLSEIRLYGRQEGTPDLVYVIGDGRGSDSRLRIQGSFDDLNAALGSLVYTPDPDYNNPDMVPTQRDLLNITVIDADSAAVPPSGSGGGGGGNSPGPVTIEQVTTNANALRNALLGPGVIAVGNATLVSSGVSAGFFSGGSTSLGIGTGIVLSSGDVNAVAGPNANDFDSFADASGSGDADLDAEFASAPNFGGTTDTTYLQFDFQLAPGGPQDLYFDFVFASEEYNEFANSSFNDVFAFFLDGVNIAFIPGTTTPISINTINGGGPIYGTNPQNPQYYHNNDLGDGGAYLADFGMDGFTSVFKATALGIGPGVHRIKLAISDTSDTNLDSAVFLAAGSFSNLPVIGSGKHSSDWNNTPSNAAIDNPNIPQGWKSAVTLTVDPVQDRPKITLPPSPTILEDAATIVLPITLFDPDAQSTPVVGPGTLIYDPNWEAQVTLSVQHGQLRLPATSVAALIFPSDIDGDGQDDDVNNDGVVDGADALAGSFQTLIFRGPLDALNAALAGLQYKVDAHYNSGDPTDGVADVPDELRIEVDDLGNTGSGVGGPQAATVTITVLPQQDPPAIIAPLTHTVLEDAGPFVLPRIEVFDVDARSGLATTPTPLVYDHDWLGQVILAVRYGVLSLAGDLSGLTFPTDVDADGDGLPDVSDGVDDRIIVLEGSLDALNAALDGLTYTTPLDFNTGTLSERLEIRISDLGNTDILTPTVMSTQTATMNLTVTPANDPPLILLPPSFVPAFELDEGTTAPVLLVDGSGVGIRVDDVDDAHDPAAIPLRVSLRVDHGSLTLGLTQGLTLSADWNGDGLPDFDVNGDGVVNSSDVVDGIADRAMVITGTIANLNAALATLSYRRDVNFNGEDLLRILVNDRGHTGLGATPDVPGTVTLTIHPANNPPTLSLPPVQTASEELPLVFSAAHAPPNAILVGDPDVLETLGGTLRVQLSVTSGTLTLPDVTGLTFPLDIDGDGVSDDLDLSGTIEATEAAGRAFRQITMSGTPDDVNAALDGMIYQGNLDFNGTDKLVVLVNDQGNTGVGPDPSPDVTGTVTITVAPVNDTPTVSVPGQRNGWEETDLPLTGIVVGDAQDEAYANVTLEVTLQAVHGTLHVRTDVAGGVVMAGGNHTGSVVLIGSPLRINRTLADPTGVIYRGEKDFNDYSLDGDPDLDEQVVVTVNDRGAVGSGGAQLITGIIPISLAQVNDAPSILTPGQRTLNEDTTLPIPLIVQDIDADETPADPLQAVTVTLRLTDTTGQPLTTAGSLSVNPAVPGGIEDGVNGYITGSGSALVTISGSPAAITATLANTNGLVYLPPANFNGRLALVAVVADHGNSGGGTSLTQTVTVPIQVTAVNDPPAAGDDSYATDEDTRLTVAVPGVLGNDSDVEGSPLTPRVIGSTTHGTLAFNANGSFSYVPSANFHGVDSFTYRVNDGTADSNLATVTITVNSSNDAPLAVNDSYLTREDEALSVAAPGVLSNDVDVDGDLLVPTVVTGPTLGNVQVFADGSFTYTPGGNAFGTDQFTYTVNDGSLDSNLATVTITVTPVNDLPVAAANTYSTIEDTTLTIAAPGVLGNDVDVDGDSLTALLVTGPVSGTLTLNANGSFAYTPNLNFWGTDNFSYQAHDGQGVSIPVTVTITVNAVNDRPVAVGDSYTTAEDTPLTIAAPGVLGNDLDVEANLLTAILVASPAHGTLALNGNGSLTYTPAADYHGGDSFTYRAKDATLTSTNVATVSITVTPVNDAPVAFDDSYSTAEDQPLTVSAPGILTNDTDADGDLLNVRLVDSPATGVLTLNANGSFTYTPAADFHGTDLFTYEAWDASVGSTKATVTITVTPVNDPPVAANDSYLATEDTVLTIAAPGLLANDGDVDGDGLTARLIGGPAHGTATVNADGSFTYTPAANYHGPDSFTYRARDAVADSNPATVSLTVAAANDAPVAIDDQYSINEDATLTVAAPGVRGNDTDVDGDPLTTHVVNPPSHGTLTLNANGSFTYTPTPDYRGQDGFTYKANDGIADSNAATVTITIVPVNDPPVAANDAYTTAEDSVLTVAAPGVKANDTDSDGDAFTVRVIGQPAHGSVTLNADGSFTYLPAADFAGTDTFTYRANDIVADSNLATVTITLTPANDVPAAEDDRYATLQDMPLVVAAPGILFNDTDVDGDGLTVSAVGLPVHGSLTLNANGSFSYVPDTGYVGLDSFTYQAHDGTVPSNVATVTITVTDSNDPPHANHDTYTTAEDQPLAVAVSGVLANDTDTDGNPLTAGVVSSPASGSLALLGNGAFTYTPNADFHGSDQFTYRTFDGLAYSNVATVTITVTPVNDAPVAANDSYSTVEDTPLTVAAPGVLGNDLDVDGNSLTAGVVAPAGHGTLVLNANGSLIYTPAADYHGTDTFTYKVRDGVADSNVATVTITVTPVNDAPLALGDSYAADEDVPLAIAAPGVLGNDLDAEGSPLTADVVSPPSHGTLTLSGDGSFLYTPAADFNGTDSFTYAANDGSWDSNVATVTITVAADNDAPILHDDHGTTNEDEPMTFEASQLLGNDRPGPTAPPGAVDNEQAQTLTVVSVSASSSQGGTVTFNANTGLITYTPRLDFVGEDTVLYHVVDNGLPTSAEGVGTLTITVVPVNDPPRAVSDAYSVDENAVLNVVAPGLLGNDYHPDGRPFGGQSQLVVTSQGVAVQIGADGSFQFDPTTKTVFRKLGDGETALDSFLYQIVDADGRQSVGTVMLTVRGISDPPYHNAANPPDVSGDDGVSPLDALLVINMVNSYGTGAIPPATPLDLYVDVNADGLLTAGDALGVVNYLNAAAAAGAGAGEGEAALEQNSTLNVSPTLPPANAPLLTIPDARLSRPVERAAVTPGETLRALPSMTSDEAHRPDDSARVSRVVAADEADMLFEGLDSDYPGVDDALTDILQEVGPAASEAATDELFGRLFG